MNIPLFPEFKDIDLSMKDDITRFLSRYPIEASEYTFTNLFAFKGTYDFKVSILNDSLIILKNRHPISLFCPVSDTPDLQRLFGYMKGQGAEPCFERVPESFVKKHLEGDERYICLEERDQFDYLHDVQELIDLKGRRFHDKKNRVNRFRSEYKYEYQTLTAELVDECIEFEDYWCEVRECEKYYGLDRERCAIFAMLRNFKYLNLKGGVIRIDNRIAALTIAEQFLSDTIVIHVEKANPDIQGLYQVINQEFLMHEAGDVKFVNREQDLGIKGLRDAKMSYHPVKFIKKYRVTE
ncbi:MAG: phosphatidylglycerol lysyltransferase domain-containing protein [Thermodesulfovibrionia bacterium]|nr:phosphatidylglycerol lysyltransferase domain-containing protein [Thermodesulfovibrionia bacterium]